MYYFFNNIVYFTKCSVYLCVMFSICNNSEMFLCGCDYFYCSTQRQTQNVFFFFLDCCLFFGGSLYFSNNITASKHMFKMKNASSKYKVSKGKQMRQRKNSLWALDVRKCLFHCADVQYHAE